MAAAAGVEPVWVFHGDARDTSAWAIVCCFPGCVWVGMMLESGVEVTLDRTQAF